MTIDEARELCQLQLESLMSNPQVTLDPKYIQAERMAIKSLEAWEKVKAEIEELEKSYGFDKATKYGNKDEKQMDLSYSTMYMYEIAGTVDEIKEIINKHLQERSDKE